ncbi:MAG TPA: undecaprenyldiphospho-muramoylpentapeptide beta-N-acetylglucosaminyltransferase [Bacilli bacterium]|nr:undecaprenyldiphospho-muramoylpentapeptide beta-N-acetylglucosaminyltransferase [Bacilli bacterium]
MKKIVFTGGGSAGHVTPNLAIIPKLQERGWDVEYIGSLNGIEKQIIEDFGIPYHGIASGKLRRYFDLKNFKDPFRVLQGLFQAYAVLRRIKPQIVFSKGGFVSVPVIVAAWLNKIPVIIHESDMTMGLANKLSAPFAGKVCVTFPEAKQHFAADKAVHTGSPIREAVLQGDARQGRALLGFDTSKPVLLVMGGSLGSEKINKAIIGNLQALTEQFQIVHICGKGNIDKGLTDVKGYRQFEYISGELPDVFATVDLFVSRAGSNAIFEFLALRKPNVLIPLSRQASRGDQILNARSFEKMGYSRVLMEEELNKETLISAIQETYHRRHTYEANMKNSPVQDAVQTIVQLIEGTAKPSR